MRITMIHFTSNELDPNHLLSLSLADYPSVCKAQNLSCYITIPESQTIRNACVTTLQESTENKKGKIIEIIFACTGIVII